MLRRVAALYALVVLSSIGAAVAQTTDTVTLQTTDRITVSGTLESIGSGSMVVRIDQHGHSIPFQIASASEVPSGLKPGSRVTVVYHPLGATGQMADTRDARLRVGTHAADRRIVELASADRQRSGEGVGARVPGTTIGAARGIAFTLPCPGAPSHGQHAAPGGSGRAPRTARQPDAAGLRAAPVLSG